MFSNSLARQSLYRLNDFLVGKGSLRQRVGQLSLCVRSKTGSRCGQFLMCVTNTYRNCLFIDLTTSIIVPFTSYRLLVMFTTMCGRI